MTSIDAYIKGLSVGEVGGHMFLLLLLAVICLLIVWWLGSWGNGR